MDSLRLHLALFFALAICGSLLCGFARGDERPDSLIVYPEAKSLESHEFRGTEQLTYHVVAKFPASDVIGLISLRLHKAGWKPLTHDFLNPTLPSSQVAGWEDFLAGPKDPEPSSCVHQWIGDWKDDSENFVRYILRFKGPGCDTSDLNDLYVVAVYTPAAVAQRELQAIEQFKEQSKVK